MNRKGIGAGGAVFILVFGLLLGAGGYYFFFVNINGPSTTTTFVTVQSVSTSTIGGSTQTVTQSVTKTTTATQTLPITFTETITSLPTQTTSTTSTSTSYLAPSNVTLAFTNTVGQYLFVVQAGNTTTSGKEVGSYSVKLAGLSQGEQLTITGTTQGTGGCQISEHFTMSLWLNGQMVAQTYGYCSGGSANIDYKV